MILLVQNLNIFLPLGGKKGHNHIFLQNILNGKEAEGSGSCGVKWETFSGYWIRDLP